MNIQASGFGWLVGAGLIMGSASAWAQVDSCEIMETDRYSGCPKALAASDPASEPYRNECRQTAAERRGELQQWGIDTASLTDVSVFDRYDHALIDRCKADREQTRREAAAANRSNAENVDANAERARAAAEQERALQNYADEQKRSGQAMMQQQNDMLKGLGVDISGMPVDDDEELGDDEYSATELQMYQRMVDEGLAPGCDGLTDAELVECVDEALDAE